MPDNILCFFTDKTCSGETFAKTYPASGLGNFYILETGIVLQVLHLDMVYIFNISVMTFYIRYKSNSFVYC